METKIFWPLPFALLFLLYVTIIINYDGIIGTPE